ncbi:ATP-dependent DNA helicase RecG [Deinococcus reticulitermitis]|uniref:ATP-dependent DNA helicase RecG n=1 Tax=Deinococcus reticulitermitis TaxID=856736 RepID=A0A1H6WZ85_9DEIO|nr:ATP-dependent DNA helicase RecG [Deinococcus reticulitermitis]
MHLPLGVTPQELARHAVGLANARGGSVVVGADLVGGHGGRDAGELHPLMITHAIFELSGGRLTVNVQHHRLPGGTQVLTVFVPQAPYVLAAPDGAVLAWDGAHLVPVLPGTGEPVADQDYTAVVPPDASLADLDPAEVGRLRLLGRRIDAANLPDLDFLRELGLLVPSGGALRPTLAAILLAGTGAALRAHVPQAEVCYFHHQTNDVEFQFREDLRRPLPSLLLRLSELIQARNRFTPVQVGLFRVEVWDHDESVYREALLNALTHRDYTLRDVVHVHHYPDRLEIMSPGGFSGGITPGNILRHQPKRRNPLLAGVLARLGLVEQAGVGVDKMFSLMLRHGKEPPEYVNYPDAVTLTLYGSAFDSDFVRFVARKQEELPQLSLDMLIVLSVLAREGEAPRAVLARALQLPEDRTPRLLRQMEDLGLIVRAGVGRGIAYHLAPEVGQALGRERRRRLAVVPDQEGEVTERPTLLASGNGPGQPAPSAMREPEPSQSPESAPARSRAQTGTLSASGPTQSEVRAIALALARERGQVRNADLREVCGLSAQQSWRVLRGLVDAGRLVRRGSGTRGAAYELAGGPG